MLKGTPLEIPQNPSTVKPPATVDPKKKKTNVEFRGQLEGAPEQQRMRIAISGSGLPPDNPLVLEAVFFFGFGPFF